MPAQGREQPTSHDAAAHQVMWYFFLSCARDEDEIFVQRFYRDLCAEVRQRIGADSQREVGYLDGADGAGPRWPADARAALSTCQTFVALCSPKFVLDSRCGRSWTVFAERMRDYQERTDQRSEALIPLIWVGNGLPGEVFVEEGLQVAPHRTPDDEDLRVLLRLRSRRAAYRAFVVSLAHRIVETAHAQRLPPAPPGTDLAGASDAFSQRLRDRPASDRPQPVVFVIVAGTRDQMGEIRQNVQFYGARREDWAPYQPSAPQPLAARARTVAAGRLFESEVVSIEALRDRLSADGRGEIVVLLVDVWSTRITPLREALQEIDRRGGAEIAVLVPASREDLETTAHQRELRMEILGTFEHRSGPRDAMFHIGIDTVGRFDDDLARALAEARQRLDRGPRAGQPAAGGGRRPILRGP